MMQKSDCFNVSKTVVTSTDSHVTNLNNNILVCGGSGTGKSFSIADSRVLHANNETQIIVLTKNRGLDYREYKRRQGYKVITMSLKESIKGDVMYEPLDYVHNEDDYMNLAHDIITAGGSVGGGADDTAFWGSTGTQLIYSVISALKFEAKLRHRKANSKMPLRLFNGIELDKYGYADCSRRMNSRGSNVGISLMPNCFSFVQTVPDIERYLEHFSGSTDNLFEC